MTETSGSISGARAAEIRSPIEWVERAAVLTAARLADHPWVAPLADLTLRTQAGAWQTWRRATAFVWNSSGVATFDELSLLGEQLAAVRHRLPTRTRAGTR
jgi:hypothetical protein